MLHCGGTVLTLGLLPVRTQLQQLERELQAKVEDMNTRLGFTERAALLLGTLEELPATASTTQRLAEGNAEGVMAAVLHRMPVQAQAEAGLALQCAAAAVVRRLAALPASLRRLSELHVQSALWALLLRLAGRPEGWAAHGRGAVCAALTALLASFPLDFQACFPSRPPHPALPLV